MMIERPVSARRAKEVEVRIHTKTTRKYEFTREQFCELLGVSGPEGAMIKVHVRWSDEDISRIVGLEVDIITESEGAEIESAPEDVKDREDVK